MSKNKENKEYSWKRLTVEQLGKIKDISKENISEEEKDLKVGAVVNNMDYEDFINLPLEETRRLMGNADFLYEKPEADKARKNYIINGKKYNLLKNATEMTTAQYIDFEAVSKMGFDSCMPEMLSIFLVPDGHQYNDGYDKDEVLEDIKKMSVTEALGVADFFTKKYAKLIMRTLNFSEALITAQRIMAKKEQKEMMKAMELETKLIIAELRSIYGCLL